MKFDAESRDRHLFTALDPTNAESTTSGTSMDLGSDFKGSRLSFVVV